VDTDLDAPGELTDLFEAPNVHVRIGNHTPPLGGTDDPISDW
jgi:hypothetical protein